MTDRWDEEAKKQTELMLSALTKKHEQTRSVGMALVITEESIRDALLPLVKECHRTAHEAGIERVARCYDDIADMYKRSVDRDPDDPECPAFIQAEIEARDEAKAIRSLLTPIPEEGK